MNVRVKPLVNDHLLKNTSFKDHKAIRFLRWLRHTYENHLCTDHLFVKTMSTKSIVRHNFLMTYHLIVVNRS